MCALWLDGVERIINLSTQCADAASFREEGVRTLFTAAEFADLDSRFRREIIDGYGSNPSEWDERLVSGDRAQHLRDLKDAILAFAALRPDDAALSALSARAATCHR